MENNLLQTYDEENLIEIAPETVINHNNNQKKTSFVALLSYGVACVISNILTKYILSKFNEHFLFILLFLGALLSFTILNLLKVFKIITIRSINLKILYEWRYVSLLLIIMKYSGIASLRYLPLSVCSIFNNFIIILTAIGETIFYKRKINPIAWFCFILMFIGSLIRANGEKIIVKSGYFYITLNSLSTASYALYVKKKISDLKFNDYDTMNYNSLSIILPLFTISIIHDHWKMIYHKYFSSKNSILYGNGKELLIFCFILAFFSFLIYYLQARAIRLCTSTSFTMAGSLNKIPTSIVSFIIFKSEDILNLKNIFCIFIAVLAGIGYSVSESIYKSYQNFISSHFKKKEKTKRLNHN